VMAERKGRGGGAGGRALLLIDIAVPRDVDSRCGDLDGVTLYDIDDLQAVVQRNLGTRAAIVPQAEEIVEDEIRRFARWLGQAETLPTVAALRERGNEIVERILAENSGRWESGSERDLMRVEAVARAVVGRLLHEPTIRLRSLSQERGHASLQLVRELFGLDDESSHSDAPAADSADAGLAEVRSIKSARKGS
jgi:glutamyl-tRNA reductase